MIGAILVAPQCLDREAKILADGAKLLIAQVWLAHGRVVVRKASNDVIDSAHRATLAAILALNRKPPRTSLVILNSFRIIEAATSM